MLKKIVVLIALFLLYTTPILAKDYGEMTVKGDVTMEAGLDVQGGATVANGLGVTGTVTADYFVGDGSGITGLQNVGGSSGGVFTFEDGALQLDDTNSGYNVNFQNDVSVGNNLRVWDGLYLDTTRIDNGSNKIDGEQIADDTIDDDSLDLIDITLADLTFDVGSVSTIEYGYLNNVTSPIQTQLNAKQTTIIADSLPTGVIVSDDILNDTINSEDYAPGSIDHEHLAVNVITGATLDSLADADEFLFYDVTGNTLDKIVWSDILNQIISDLVTKDVTVDDIIVMGDLSLNKNASVSGVAGYFTLMDENGIILGRSAVPYPSTDGQGGFTTFSQYDEEIPWRVWYSNADGDITELALGGNGEYLKSTGVSSTPTWGVPTGTSLWVDQGDYTQLIDMDDNVSLSAALTVFGVIYNDGFSTATGDGDFELIEGDMTINNSLTAGAIFLADGTVVSGITNGDKGDIIVTNNGATWELEEQNYVRFSDLTPTDVIYDGATTLATGNEIYDWVKMQGYTTEAGTTIIGSGDGLWTDYTTFLSPDLTHVGYDVSVGNDLSVFGVIYNDGYSSIEGNGNFEILTGDLSLNNHMYIGGTIVGFGTGISTLDGDFSIDGNLTVANNVVATQFIGDGSLLTNLPTGNGTGVGGLWGYVTPNTIQPLTPSDNVSIGSNLTVAAHIYTTNVGYGISWDNNNTVPTKNAIYDEIESIGGGLWSDGGSYIEPVGATTDVWLGNDMTVDGTIFSDWFSGINGTGNFEIIEGDLTINNSLTAQAIFLADGTKITGGGLADGDKGDITVGSSATSFTIDNNAVSADELDATGVEAELEAVIDLVDLQGEVTTAQLPDNITEGLIIAADLTNANAKWLAVDYPDLADGDDAGSGAPEIPIDLASDNSVTGILATTHLAADVVLDADITSSNDKWLAVTYPDLADGDDGGLPGAGDIESVATAGLLSGGGISGAVTVRLGVIDLSSDNTVSGILASTHLPADLVYSAELSSNSQLITELELVNYELNSNLTNDVNKWLQITYPALYDGDDVGTGGGAGAPTDGYYVVTEASSELTLDKILAVDSPLALTISGTNDGAATIGVLGGYAIPTTIALGQYDTAYGWGDWSEQGFITSNGDATITGNLSLSRSLTAAAIFLSDGTKITGGGGGAFTSTGGIIQADTLSDDLSLGSHLTVAGNSSLDGTLMVNDNVFIAGNATTSGTLTVGNTLVAGYIEMSSTSKRWHLTVNDSGVLVITEIT